MFTRWADIKSTSSGGRAGMCSRAARKFPIKAGSEESSLQFCGCYALVLDSQWKIERINGLKKQIT
jgi:hypothetical protein